jgi:hypothetical protein
LIGERTPAEAANLAASLCVGVVFFSTGDKTERAEKLDQIFEAAREMMKKMSEIINGST